MLLSIAATIAMVVSVSSPMARPYTGSWPMTVTHSERSNGTYCLTLKDNGDRSGYASLVDRSGSLPFGTFRILNHILVATIDQPGGYADAALVFIAPADGGSIGKGVFEQVYGGEPSDLGDLAFGTKGGC